MLGTLALIIATLWGLALFAKLARLVVHFVMWLMLHPVGIIVRAVDPRGLPLNATARRTRDRIEVDLR